MKLYKDASMCAHFYGNIETSLQQLLIIYFFLATAFFAASTISSVSKW